MIVVEGTAAIDDVDAFLEALEAAASPYRCAATAIDARYVACAAHLEAAVARANRALDRDDAIADDPAIEVLLYAAGRRQIERALTIGVSEGRGPVAIVVNGAGQAAADEPGAAGEVADLVDRQPVLGSVREVDRIRSFFDIGEAELAATDAPLCDLVVERVSLLAVEK